MHSFIMIWLLFVGASEAVLWQRLSCPYGPEHRVLQRVWCRKTSAVCCTGLAFSHSAHLVDEGKLRVTQDSQSFNVEVLKPGHRGVYWCGVLSRNNTIIRLAEGNLYSSLGAYIWSFARWILLPLLPTVTIFIYMYSTIKTTDCKKEDEAYDDVAVSRVLTNPENSDTVSPCQLV